MVTDLVVTRSVMLQASPARVWEVLTDPAMTRHYMNDCSVMSDWQVGNAINWKDDNDQVRYKGNILEYEAGKKIAYSYFDPQSGDEDYPSSYVNVCYLVVPRNGVTELLVTLTNFRGDDTRAEHVAENWDFEVLPKLKSLAEEHSMVLIH